MDTRPILNASLDSKTFKSYYYLKEELIKFCKENNLPISGNKIELTDRISYFLDTKEIKKSPKKIKSKINVDVITKDSLIEENITFSEKHRAFFKENIGKKFSFNILFQKWLKENAGKPYKDAINAYYQTLKVKKENKTTIGKQFEYNTYIRDFFEDNKDKTLNEAILCWKYKKSLKGTNKYERSDLIVLNDKTV